MKPPLRMPPARGPFGLLLLCLLAACQDSAPTAPAAGPQFDISEARFGNGNPDFFFYSPLAASPSPSDPDFDEGASNGALTPHLRVCAWPITEAPPGATDACDGTSFYRDVTAEVTGSSTGLAMTYQEEGEVYQVNFSTRDLNPANAYRLEIWGVGFDASAREAISEIVYTSGDLEGTPRWRFGYRDIADSPSTAACTGLEVYCFVKFGSQTIPVKVRVEGFAFCPESRNCSTQFVASGEDARLEAIFPGGSAATSAQLLIPGQENTDFALSFEPCSIEDMAKVRAYAQFPVYDPCVKTIVPPIYDETIILANPLTVEFCDHIDQASFALADPSQINQVEVHHFSTAGDPNGPIQAAEALPPVTPTCAPSGLASVEPEGSLTRFVFDAGKRLRSLFEVKSLVALDRGGGGQSSQPESFFTLGLPTKLQYEFSGDDFRVAVAGSTLALRVKATDANGAPVLNARPDWRVASSPGNPPPQGDAVVVTPVPNPTGLDGISETTVTLSTTRGNNVFHAGGIGLADPRDGEVCTLPSGAASLCNGPMAGFDPFQADDEVITLPLDTYLPLTVFGCTPGFGTPAAADGTLAPGEWDCANRRTFPVNLSGGSTVQATLYWMNDATDFHIAVSVPGTDRRNKLRIEWDNAGAPTATPEGGVYSAARTPGDDVWELDPRSTPADKFVDDGCSGSGQSGCGSDDAAFGGAMQTRAGFNNSTGGVTVYEMSHPLTTADECTLTGRRGCSAGFATDIRLGAASHAGFFVTLSLGNGAQGDTQDPGFLQYRKVVIK